VPKGRWINGNKAKSGAFVDDNGGLVQILMGV